MTSMLPSRISLLLFCFFVFFLNLNAQISFVDDTTIPFADVSLGKVALTDIDNDIDEINCHLDLYAINNI